MVGEFEVRGTEDLVRLSRALKAAGEGGKGLRRELRSGLNRETKETRAEMRAAILPALPSRGGLAADVHRSTRLTTTAATGSNAGVRIRARGRRSIRRMNDAGSFRHPVFGNRDVWVTQSVKRGFLNEPFQKSRPELQRAIVATIDRVRSQIYRSV